MLSATPVTDTALPPSSNIQRTVLRRAALEFSPGRRIRCRAVYDQYFHRDEVSTWRIMPVSGWIYRCSGRHLPQQFSRQAAGGVRGTCYSYHGSMFQSDRAATSGSVWEHWRPCCQRHIYFRCLCVFRLRRDVRDGASCLLRLYRILFFRPLPCSRDVRGNCSILSARLGDRQL